MIHLICGPMGSGKSTYGLKLADEIKGIFFSTDDWLNGLFPPDRTSLQTLAKSVDSRALCEKQIWEICLQLLGKGIPVVLEGKTSKREERENWKDLANEHAYPLKFHFIEADQEVRRERVLKRNTELGNPYTNDVLLEIFDYMEIYHEAPDAIELKSARNTAESQ